MQDIGHYNEGPGVYFTKLILRSFVHVSVHKYQS